MVVNSLCERGQCRAVGVCAAAQSGAAWDCSAALLVPALPVMVRHSSPEHSKRELERGRRGTFCRSSHQPRSSRALGKDPRAWRVLYPSPGLSVSALGCTSSLGGQASQASSGMARTTLQETDLLVEGQDLPDKALTALNKQSRTVCAFGLKEGASNI